VLLRDRQQRLIAPHIQRAFRDGLAGKTGADVIEVVLHLKRGETLITDRKRLNSVALAAFPTSQFVSSHRFPRSMRVDAGMRARDRLQDGANVIDDSKLLAK